MMTVTNLSGPHPEHFLPGTPLYTRENKDLRFPNTHLGGYVQDRSGTIHAIALGPKFPTGQQLYDAEGNARFEVTTFDKSDLEVGLGGVWEKVPLSKNGRRDINAREYVRCLKPVSGSLQSDMFTLDEYVAEHIQTHGGDSNKWFGSKVFLDSSFSDTSVHYRISSTNEPVQTKEDGTNEFRVLNRVSRIGPTSKDSGDFPSCFVNYGGPIFVEDLGTYGFQVIRNIRRPEMFYLVKLIEFAAFRSVNVVHLKE